MSTPVSVYCAICSDRIGYTSDPRGDVGVCDRHAAEPVDERWDPTWLDAERERIALTIPSQAARYYDDAFDAKGGVA